MGDNDMRLMGLYDGYDFYKKSRDEYLIKRISNYPDEVFSCFFLSFVIHNNTTKAPLVYAILETIKASEINKNEVAIRIESEKEFVSSFRSICDLILIVRIWKNVVLQYNNIQFDPVDGFGYLKNHFEERYANILEKNIGSIQYLPHKKRKLKKEEIVQIQISRTDLPGAFQIVIDKYIELYGQNKEVKILTVSRYDKVVMIENDLIVDFRLVPCYWAREDQEKDWEWPYIMIQELTHNNLFKFNASGFQRCFQCNQIGIDFYFFRGLHIYRKEIDNFDVVDKALPELQLKRRYEEYPGEVYHFILLRMMDTMGKTVYGIGNTKGAVHSFILKLCNELEKKDSWSLLHNGASCLPVSKNIEFVSAFLSWKGKRKRWRLENYFSYFYEDKAIKDDREINVYYDSILKGARSGRYDSEEFGFYLKPLNRWKSEELVYNITKKLYKDYQVIYQYKPFFLATENGNMSYDIYICGLKTAIEYQGKQHFEPIEYFGGTEHFKQQQERDELKAKLSEENGVKLVYINYWESITADLIRQRVEE